MVEIYRPKVLLVEDEDVIMQLSKEILHDIMDCDVIEAWDGEEAVGIVKRLSEAGRHADLYLTDVMMPKMSGFEFLKEIKERGYDGVTPSIVNSGFHLDESEKRYVEQMRPVIAFMNKPWNVHILMFNVYKALTISPNQEDVVSYLRSKVPEMESTRAYQDLYRADLRPRLVAMGVIGQPGIESMVQPVVLGAPVSCSDPNYNSRN